MEGPPVPSNAFVRSEWIQMVVGQVQAAVELADTDLGIDSLDRFVTALPRADSTAERLVLRGVLLEFAYRFGAHASAHTVPRDDATTDLSAAALARFLAIHEPDVAIAEWANAFRAGWRRAHPRLIAEQAVAAIRSDVAAKWTLPRLASHLGVTVRELRRSFRDDYHTTMREYLQAMRIIASFQLLRSEKVEVAARMVGYHSVKNYYRSFSRIVGVTPAGFRRWSHAHAAAIAAGLESTVSKASGTIRRSIADCGTP